MLPSLTRSLGRKARACSAVRRFGGGGGDLVPPEMRPPAAYLGKALRETAAALKILGGEEVR